jgi:hypothetical protein
MWRNTIFLFSLFFTFPKATHNCWMYFLSHQNRIKIAFNIRLWEKVKGEKSFSLHLLRKKWWWTFNKFPSTRFFSQFSYFFFEKILLTSWEKSTLVSFFLQPFTLKISFIHKFRFFLLVKVKKINLFSIRKSWI